MAHPTNRKWVVTPLINGVSRVNPLIIGVITQDEPPRRVKRWKHTGLRCAVLESFMPRFTLFTVSIQKDIKEIASMYTGIYLSPFEKLHLAFTPQLGLSYNPPLSILMAAKQQ